jgi:hypothetical protein
MAPLVTLNMDLQGENASLRLPRAHEGTKVFSGKTQKYINYNIILV